MSTPALLPVPFWFLRHGLTDWNTRNLAQGSTDVPLNQDGLDQAVAAASLLAGRGITRIVSSPLLRARATTDIVNAVLHVPVTIDPDLRETAFGVREGTEMLAAWFSAWIAGSATPDGAESFADLRLRAVGAVNPALAAPGLVLFVAHGGLFRALRAAMGLDPDQRLPNGTPLFCRPQGSGQPWHLDKPDLPLRRN